MYLTRPKAHCQCTDCFVNANDCEFCKKCVPEILCVSLSRVGECCPPLSVELFRAGMQWTGDPSIFPHCTVSDIRVYVTNDPCLFILRIEYVGGAAEEHSTDLSATGYQISVVIPSPEYGEADVSIEVAPKPGTANPNYFRRCEGCDDACTCLPETLCVTYSIENTGGLVCDPLKQRKQLVWDECLESWGTASFVFNLEAGGTITRDVTVQLGAMPYCGVEVTVATENYAEEPELIRIPLLPDISKGIEKFCEVQLSAREVRNTEEYGSEMLEILDSCSCTDLSLDHCPEACRIYLNPHSDTEETQCDVVDIVGTIIAPEYCEHLDGRVLAFDPLAELGPEFTAPSEPTCWSSYILYSYFFVENCLVNYEFKAVLYYPDSGCGLDENAPPDPTKYIVAYRVTGPCGVWEGITRVIPETASCDPIFFEFEMDVSGEPSITEPDCPCCQGIALVRITE